MMWEVRAGWVARVVCYKLDRLGRSLTHLALMLDELNRLHCRHDGFDGLQRTPDYGRRVGRSGCQRRCPGPFVYVNNWGLNRR